MARLSEEQESFIRAAAHYLEAPSFVMRLTRTVGKPIELTLQKLPQKAQQIVHRASRKAMDQALKTALETLNRAPQSDRSFSRALHSSRLNGGLHGAGAALTGAVGGFWGLAALPIELPLTTTLMLRSISQIARDFGEDLSAHEAQLQCLYVFSLTGPETPDHPLQHSYYSSRLVFAQLIEKASAFVTAHTLAQALRGFEGHAAPALVELMVRIASRFEIVVGRKLVGQLVPGLGAGMGALLNVAFIDYFNEVARFHFGLRRLEREFGAGPIQNLYERALAEGGSHRPRSSRTV